MNENERKTKGSLVGSHVGSPGVYSGGYRTYSGEGAPTKIVELHEGRFLHPGGTLSARDRGAVATVGSRHVQIESLLSLTPS